MRTPGSISSEATVADTARVSDRARVLDRAKLLDYAVAREDARVRRRAVVRDWADVRGSSCVSDSATVQDATRVDGYAGVRGCAVISNNVCLSGTVQVSDNARVYGSAHLSAGSIGQDADIFRDDHVIVLSGVFIEQVTVYRTADGGHRVQVGCQNFQLTDDLAALAAEHGWGMPPGWKTLRDGLLAVAGSWRNDVCTD